MTGQFIVLEHLVGWRKVVGQLLCQFVGGAHIAECRRWRRREKYWLRWLRWVIQRETMRITPWSSKTISHNFFWTLLLCHFGLPMRPSLINILDLTGTLHSPQLPKVLNSNRSFCCSPGSRTTDRPAGHQGRNIISWSQSTLEYVSRVFAIWDYISIIMSKVRRQRREEISVDKT